MRNAVNKNIQRLQAFTHGERWVLGYREANIAIAAITGRFVLVSLSPFNVDFGTERATIAAVSDLPE